VIVDVQTRRPAPIALVIIPVVLVAIVALLTATLEHQACFHPGPPVDRPEAATPRGEYCSALNSAAPWVTLTVVPMAVMAVLAFATRRWPWLIATLTLLLCAALIANAVVANSLTYSLTF
jgi:hypothetical protein